MIPASKSFVWKERNLSAIWMEPISCSSMTMSSNGFPGRPDLISRKCCNTWMVCCHASKDVVCIRSWKGVNNPVVPEVSIVDPTGVGDAFGAGSWLDYARGWSWQLCGQMVPGGQRIAWNKRAPRPFLYPSLAFVKTLQAAFLMIKAFWIDLSIIH